MTTATAAAGAVARGSQLSLIDTASPWEAEWLEMPEYRNDDLTPNYQLTVQFATEGDVQAFADLVDQSMTLETRSIWYPENEPVRAADKRYANGGGLHPRHPVYIVSKGRWDSSLTHRFFVADGLRHFIVVEEQEFEAYNAVIDHAFCELLVLDPEYKRSYDTFSKLGEGMGTGSGPARNFAWDHAKANGATSYWCVDDNIYGFFRFNLNHKTPCSPCASFWAMEEFAQRYPDVAIVGPNYRMFITRRKNYPAFYVNTRIYSCNLIRCDLPFQWRGRYNEDTDLSLRAIKAGYKTVLFNAFLQWKMATQSMGGGNTDTIYQAGTKAKSEMLVAMHPDCAAVIWRFGRWHHYVDYSMFQAQLVRKPEFTNLSREPNNFGMVMQQSVGPYWIDIPTPADGDQLRRAWGEE